MEVAELKEENQQLLHFRSEQKKLGQEVQELRRKEAVLQEEKELFERESADDRQSLFNRRQPFFALLLHSREG